MADTDDNEARKASDPKEQEDQWKAIMFTVAIIGGGVLAIVLWRYVFQDGDTEEAGRRMTLMVPIGTLYIAAVTFLMTYWRGLITTRQADQQREQLDAIARQADAQSEAGLADLLQRGAEALSDAEQERHPAGLAVLEAVATSKSDRYAVPAMNLMVDYIEKNYAGDGSDIQSQLLADTIHHILETTGRMATRSVTLQLPPIENIRVYGPTHTKLFGTIEVVYEGGRYSVRNLAPYPDLFFRFRNVVMDGCVIIDDGRVEFDSCKFVNCRFRHYDNLGLHNSIAYSCDFSGVDIRIFDTESPFFGPRNYYFLENPPVFLGPDKERIDPNKYLNGISIFDIDKYNDTYPNMRLNAADSFVGITGSAAG